MADNIKLYFKTSDQMQKQGIYIQPSPAQPSPARLGSAQLSLNTNQTCYEPTAIFSVKLKQWGRNDFYICRYFLTV
jgi:hypothetical protein